MAAAGFEAAWAALPPPVQAALKQDGIDQPDIIVHSVQARKELQPDGTTLVVEPDQAWTLLMSKKYKVQEGTADFARLALLYRAAWRQTFGDASPKADEAIKAKDPLAEEYYELDPLYRRKRLDALEQERGYLPDPNRMPSRRMWGRLERLRRTQADLEPIPFDKVQSEAQALRSRPRQELAPAPEGVLAWRAPAIQEKKPANYAQFEDVLYTIENGLWLTGWCSSISALERFHQRFMQRIRHNHDVHEVPAHAWSHYEQAYLAAMRHWAKESKGSALIDEAVAATTLDTDAGLDIRLALALPPVARTAAASPDQAGGDQSGHKGGRSGRRTRTTRQRSPVSGTTQRQPHKQQQPQHTQRQQKPQGKRAASGQPARERPAAARARANTAGGADESEPCRYYVTNKRCRFGNSCKFSHAQ